MLWVKKSVFTDFELLIKGVLMLELPRLCLINGYSYSSELHSERLVGLIYRPVVKVFPAHADADIVYLSRGLFTPKIFLVATWV